jgi:hypothetical protein
MFFDGFVSQRTVTTTAAAESDILTICGDKATRKCFSSRVGNAWVKVLSPVVAISSSTL